MSTTDRLVLKDLAIFARHGLFDAEAELGQRFYIDVTIHADLSYAENADEADGTVNWANLVEVTTTAFTERRYKLIEAATAAIAKAVLAHFDRATHVRVEVRKPSAPIEALFAYTSVIIERDRA
jgi:7,8-dihydroneopterin aldolase/epimerase/oxygenase